MTLTPNDIQKQEFSTKMFNGLDPDEVRSFLIYVAEHFEKSQRKKEKLEEKVSRLEEKVDDLVGREELLKRTIMSTQKWSDEHKQKSKKEAELITKEAEIQAEEIINNALKRKKKIDEQIGDLIEKKYELVEEIERVINNFEKIKKRIEESKEEDNVKAFVPEKK